ncbi:proton-dependent oligopeptide transporter, POT family [Parapedobacter composti]|uniref:Proton-dependent oligopeptide transporter, POT family n=1 Tax=Parapedobacter composti TaxID=623281 RepID=A0A1I1K4I2_9SPHI|nr:peptide MFS transporter [Parapedobacter composti]SFC55636.1 proton-dependent oligopeptide transporter, POT family [Parapedobacter composti]
MTDLNNVVSKERVLKHPAGLFILFFTEMWERFSYYGMRALLVLFLVSAAGLGGWEMSRSEALSLYGVYTGLVYLTPILGGMIADKWLGHRWAVALGALIMTLGHASMALEGSGKPFFYLGLALLILGNGLFKPNISTIVGGLYSKEDENKKDSAYTIFYMGINSGAFLGILLCGYIGEKVGWHWGFGLAGIFMFFGMLQFWFAQRIFGKIGEKPTRKSDDIEAVYADVKKVNEESEAFEGFDQHAVGAEIDKRLPNISAGERASMLKEMKDRLMAKIAADRTFVILVLAFVTIFFWMAFEQAGGSMTIFARDYTGRVLTGGAATTFTVINALLAIVPLSIITWVLFLLIKATMKKYAISNMWLSFSFVIIWGVVIWMVGKDLNTKAYEVSFSYVKSSSLMDTIAVAGAGDRITLAEYIQSGAPLEGNERIDRFEAHKIGSDMFAVHIDYRKEVSDNAIIRSDENFAVDQHIAIVDIDQNGNYIYIDAEDEARVGASGISAQVVDIKESEIEIPASWFGVLNSLFIILFAPVFSKLWETKFNPSAPKKFALGLFLVGLGFAVLAFGSMTIPKGATTASVSIVWLILAYLLHTWGELAISPVGLSYVSKLSPPKLVGLMFGIWFLSSAIANYLAGLSGSYIDRISEKYGLIGFFLIFTALPMLASLALVLANKVLVRKMHGIH